MSRPPFPSWSSTTHLKMDRFVVLRLKLFQPKAVCLKLKNLKNLGCRQLFHRHSCCSTPLAVPIPCRLSQLARRSRKQGSSCNHINISSYQYFIATISIFYHINISLQSYQYFIIRQYFSPTCGTQQIWTGSSAHTHQTHSTHYLLLCHLQLLKHLKLLWCWILCMNMVIIWAAMFLTS